MKGLRIVSKVDGFRRGGIAHPDTAVDHPADRFSEEQITAILAEPKLVVSEIDLPDPEPKAKGKASAA